jgi:hypothetical protein
MVYLNLKCEYSSSFLVMRKMGQVSTFDINNFRVSRLRNLCQMLRPDPKDFKQKPNYQKCNFLVVVYITISKI